MKKHNQFTLVVLLFFVLTVLLFWKTLLKGLYPFPGDFLIAWYEPWKSDHLQNGLITIPHKPIADDVFRQLYPFKILAMDMIKRFELPLWNPYNGAGMPLFATSHIGFLNPLNILFFFFSNEIAWSLQIMSAPFLSGISTYLYLRKINLSKTAATFSSIIYILSGFSVARMIFGEYILALPGLPFILYLTECFFNDSHSKKIALIPISVFLLIISGHIQTTFYILLFIFLYIAHKFFFNKSSYKKTGILTLLFLCGVGLGSIQLFPTLELLLNSNFSTSSSQFIFQRFLLPVNHFVTLFIPNYFGNQATYNFWGYGDYIETITYLGLIPDFFAYISIWGLKREMKSLVFFFGMIITATILITIDSPFSRTFFRIPIPILSTGVPTRIFFLTTFSMSILAGMGIDTFLANSKKIIHSPKLFGGFLIYVAAIVFATYLAFVLKIPCSNEIISSCRLISLRNTLLETGVFIIGICTLLLWNLSKKKLLKKASISTLFLCIIGIGLYNAEKFIPFSSKDTFLPKNQVLSKLVDTTKSSRLMGFGDGNIKTDFATFFHFYDPNYYDTLHNKRYAELISFANTGNIHSLKRSDVEVVNDIIVSDDVAQRRNRLLQILNVKYLFFKKSELENQANIVWEDKNWVIKENLKVLPRAYLSDNFEVIPEKNKELKRLFNPAFDITNTVLLEQNPENKIESYKGSQESIVSIKSYIENKVFLETSTKSKKILVLADNYFPGWKAYVDNIEIPVYRANYTLRAIIVPEGKHSIKFSYEPLSFTVGLCMSVASFGFYLLFLLRMFKKKKA